MNNSKEILTPYKALKALSDCLDKALTELDAGCEFFEIAMLPMDEVQEETNEEKMDEILKEMKGYTLMANFLLEHPLINVIKQIREESKLTEEDTTLLALKHEIEVGQLYRHYKGDVYLVRQLSKDADYPVIEQVTYQALKNLIALEENAETKPEIWSLPVSDFSKRVKFDERMVNRFQLIPKELIENDTELNQRWQDVMRNLMLT